MLPIAGWQNKQRSTEERTGIQQLASQYGLVIVPSWQYIRSGSCMNVDILFL
jgi:hypothetical protein